MRQAINYTLGLWEELNVYLQDGRLPIDNNLCENAIRPLALGRKNWLFVGSENGGHTASRLAELLPDRWQQLQIAATGQAS